METISPLRRFFRYYKPFKALFAADLAASFFICLIDLVYPMVTRTFINNAVPNRDFRLLLILAGVLLVVYTVKLGLNYFVQYYGHILGVHMQANMRRDIFAHLQKMPFTYFDENKSGALMSRVVNDLQDAAELAHHGPEFFFLSMLMMVGSFIVLCTINIPLTLIVFAFVPLFIYWMVKSRVKMERGFTESRRKTAEINAELQNSLTGIRVSKAFDNSSGEMDKFDARLDAFKKARYIAYQAMGQFNAGMFYFIDLMYLIVLVAAGIFYMNGRINIGDFTAYFLYIAQFITPIRRLMQFVEIYEEGQSGFKRFCEIMETPPEADNPGSEDVADLSGDIRFKHVTFTYGSEKNVLNDLNMTIRSGTKVALVGPSGGGKTTLCHLLPRFYDITRGEILIGDRNIEQITRSSLRRGMGIVQQEVFLFTGTIAENIGYACPDATLEEIQSAAKKANIHDYIIAQEEGYDTYVGERGIKLSGGQKQRIAIARIFLKNPQILILDEATSALDNITEYQLQQALDDLCEGRTTIVVAHRLSTVRNADEIVVLTDDGVEEQGTHDALMKNNGLYATLYNSQFSA